jgi:hypothetical protein
VVGSPLWLVLARVGQGGGGRAGEGWSSKVFSRTTPKQHRMDAEIRGSGAHHHQHDGAEFAGGLRLRPMPARDGTAFPLSHPYFEIVYAPLVGPTGILLARAMARHVWAAGGPTTVRPAELALEVGIRASSTDPLGRKSHLVHAIDHLAHVRVVARFADRVLGVHLTVPTLNDRTLAKLPAPVREAHDRYAALSGREHPRDARGAPPNL